MLDGNHLAASQRRLRVLRAKWAKGLPGRVLAVYEPDVDLVTRVFLTPDGHASERRCWTGWPGTRRRTTCGSPDRKFCTLGFLLDLEQVRARFVIRRHGTMPCTLLGRRRPRGRTGTGQVYEQAALKDGRRLRVPHHHRRA